MTAICSLSLHPKLAFSAAHVESWSADYDIKNSDFSQLWTASHKCLPQCWKLLSYSLGKKHTNISARCHCLATRLPNATLVRVCACLSKSIRCLQPKVGTRLSWANWSKMKKKIYEESLQLAQRSWYVRVAWEVTLPMTQQGKKKSNQWTLTGGLCFQLSSIREIRAFTQSQQWILLCWHSRQQFIYTSIWVTMRR